ncbi:hypothetical protein AeNC1_013104 [Aphanomyces euteiches]|nr:hypothetical protein AeNC1_013104 [Aphanomyces euteiches]
MSVEEWPLLVPLVQLVLNNTKVESLANEAPVTCMTGLPAVSTLAPIVTNLDIEVSTIEEIAQLKGLELKLLLESLDKLHKKTSAAADKARKKSKKHGVLANFDVGDFILMATVEEVSRSKLQAILKGPGRVTRVINEWLYEVENLVTKVIKDIHASRLKFNHDGDLDVTDDLLKQVTYSQEGFEVEAFGNVRYNLEAKRYEMEIKWRGLEAKENSWEPVQNLMEDVPVALKKRLRAMRNNAEVRKLILDMNCPLVVEG